MNQLVVPLATAWSLHVGISQTVAFKLGSAQRVPHETRLNALANISRNTSSSTPTSQVIINSGVARPRQVILPVPAPVPCNESSCNTSVVEKPKAVTTPVLHRPGYIALRMTPTMPPVTVFRAFRQELTHVEEPSTCILSPGPQVKALQLPHTRITSLISIDDRQVVFVQPYRASPNACMAAPGPPPTALHTVPPKPRELLHVQSDFSIQIFPKSTPGHLATIQSSEPMRALSPALPLPPYVGSTIPVRHSADEGHGGQQQDGRSQHGASGDQRGPGGREQAGEGGEEGHRFRFFTLLGAALAGTLGLSALPGRRRHGDVGEEPAAEARGAGGGGEAVMSSDEYLAAGEVQEAGHPVLQRMREAVEHFEGRQAALQLELRLLRGMRRPAADDLQRRKEVEEELQSLAILKAAVQHELQRLGAEPSSKR